MIHGFYFKFYRLTRCKWLSVLLAYLSYVVFMCKYIAEHLCYKKCIISCSKDSALKAISKVHPDLGEKYPQHERMKLDESMDLSIIVPVYNYVELIEINILSILNQKTQYRYQLILVDDGSTDGAQDILKKYETHPNVKVIFQQNRGIAGARNTGLKEATGKYIMFIDCDDTVEENLIETLMVKAYGEDCDIVMCAHNLVKEYNGEVYEILPNIYPHYNIQGFARNAQILNYAGLPWGKVYKRELWENVSFFQGYWFEDTIIHSLIFTQCGAFGYEPTVCYQYRWYEKNFSHTQGKSKNPKSIDIYWIMSHILEQYEKMQLPRDERYETMLLKHLSLYYYSKIHELQNDVVEALFILACDLYQQYGLKKKCKLPYMLRVTKRALLQGDFNLWKIATKYQR